MKAIFPALALIAFPVAGHAMPGMAMPGDAMPATDHAHDHAPPKTTETTPASSTKTPPAGTDQAAGNGPAPTAPAEHAADRFYDKAAMERARHALHVGHGGKGFHKIQFNLAEVQIHDGRTGYRWDAEGWFGGDIDRFVVKSEGAGSFGRTAEEAEVQALYSHAIGPYFDLQGGIRQDLGAGPKRTYATIGIEGIAPYWFTVGASLFLSHRGDLLGRMGISYDQRLTQRLVLQPRAELNFAAQAVPESGIGSGLSEAELGLRLRYEIKREFAPYAGVSWARKTGGSAHYARAAGEAPAATSLVFGVRAWF